MPNSGNKQQEGKFLIKNNKVSHFLTYRFLLLHMIDAGVQLQTMPSLRRAVFLGKRLIVLL